MKTSKSKKIEALLKEFNELNESLKSINNKKSELRESIMQATKGESLACGELAAIISESSRTGVDKKSLVADLGKKADKYLTTTTYTKLEVKKVS